MALFTMKPTANRDTEFRLRLVRSACLWALALLFSLLIVDPPRILLGWILAGVTGLLLIAGVLLAHRILIDPHRSSSHT
jgi:uncharacterized membrane protein